MQIKLNHRALIFLGVIASVVLIGGSFLDVVNNSLSLISNRTTYTLTALLAVAASVAHLWLKKRPLTVIKNDEGESEVYRGLDLKVVASLIGVAIVLWIPRFFDKAPSPAENPAVPTPTVVTTPTAVTTPAPEMTLTYSLMIQPRVKDRQTNEYEPSGAPYESTGQEVYGDGWDFRVTITPAQAGSLYLLNEGAGAGGALVYNVLFPTRANNNRVARLAANQTMRTESYVFDEYGGAEKLWIIWSAEPLEKLDNIFEDVDDNELVIRDPGQISAVREILARYYSSKPEVVTDKTKRQTVIKGQGNMLISLLELRHE